LSPVARNRSQPTPYGRNDPLAPEYRRQLYRSPSSFLPNPRVPIKLTTALQLPKFWPWTTSRDAPRAVTCRKQGLSVTLQLSTSHSPIAMPCCNAAGHCLGQFTTFKYTQPLRSPFLKRRTYTEYFKAILLGPQRKLEPSRFVKKGIDRSQGSHHHCSTSKHP